MYCSRQYVAYQWVDRMFFCSNQRGFFRFFARQNRKTINQDLVVSTHGGTPIAGWFTMEGPTQMGDDWGYPYDSGNRDPLNRRNAADRWDMCFLKSGYSQIINF